MEVLFHGIFSLIKLAILSSIYAALILMIFRKVGRFNEGSWADRISKRKLKFWFFSGAIISTLLVVFANTHWGSHGLGDSARIPLKHGKSVNEINGTHAYIRDIGYKYEDLLVEKFAITTDYMVGRTQASTIDFPEPYFFWQLKTNKVRYFKNREEYEKFAMANNLPLSNEFREFRDHYSSFWHGWRFWTLL